MATSGAGTLAKCCSMYAGVQKISHSGQLLSASFAIRVTSIGSDRIKIECRQDHVRLLTLHLMADQPQTHCAILPPRLHPFREFLLLRSCRLLPAFSNLFLSDDLGIGGMWVCKSFCL